MKETINSKEELQESGKLYKELWDNAPVAYHTLNTKGIVTQVNQTEAKMLGYTPEEMIGKSIFEFILPEQREKAQERFRQKISGKRIPMAVNRIYVKKDGSKINVSINDVLERNREGKVIGIRTTMTDVTELKKAEEEKEKLQTQLIQSEKMAGIGTLAGGIAHEFNNLLQIMKGHIEFAQITKKPKDIKKALDVVISASDRATKIIRDLLAFSRKEALKKELCDITELIELVLSLTEGELNKNNIKVVKKYEKIPMLKINKGEMQQVFLNMVTNARDAILPKSGKLEIWVREVEKHVKVSFSDTGMGIKKEDLGKVFEPFYTTKGPIGGSSTISGTGLGLSVSYGIVKRHGGIIEVESKEGKGMIFTIKLPMKRVKTKKKIIKEKKKREIKKTKPLDILVVDDEEDLCKIFTKILSLEGHRAKAVTTGRKAINLVKKEHFDLILLDIVMPGISGIEVLDRVKKISPKTRVVMITGKLLNKDLLKELKQKGASAFLQKPTEIEDIREIIKRK